MECYIAILARAPFLRFASRFQLCTTTTVPIQRNEFKSDVLERYEFFFSFVKPPVFSFFLDLRIHSRKIIILGITFPSSLYYSFLIRFVNVKRNNRRRWGDVCLVHTRFFFIFILKNIAWSQSLWRARKMCESQKKKKNDDFIFFFLLAEIHCHKKTNHFSPHTAPAVFSYFNNSRPVSH